MIYVDTSVALAYLLAEDRHPGPEFWSGVLVSSRLLEYEVWTRIHARRLGPSHGDAVRSVLGRVAFLEMIPEVLTRAREPFPVPVRTLDGLHLASVHFLVEQGQQVAVASYDGRIVAAARKMRFDVHPLD